MKILISMILISLSILISGCGQVGLDVQTKKDIAELLDIKVEPCECKYPKLPIFKVPEKKKVPNGMSIEEAFYRQNAVNEQLRVICGKYRHVAVVTNREYR